MSTKDESKLLQPAELGDLQLQNRVVMAPMTRSRAGVERMPNDLMAEYYGQRASAGLIISEGTIFSDEARGWVQTPGIETDVQAEAWRKVVDTVHDQGTPMFLQLWHCGRASHSSFHADRSLPVAPSAIKIDDDSIQTPTGKQPYETPRALETDEISRVVDDYAKAAERAVTAGFDGVEIHGANGYLIDTFLQSRSNHREDQYGGSHENRFRFLQEVVEAVGSVYPANRVGVRISPNGDYNDMGSPDFREAFTTYAERLDKYGLAYLHVLDGLSFGFHELGEPITLEDIRGVYSRPVVANCGYDQDSAESAVRTGEADLVSFARPYISNPDLVERFQNDWPLASDADESVWYSHGPEGYVDFPAYDDQ